MAVFIKELMAQFKNLPVNEQLTVLLNELGVNMNGGPMSGSENPLAKQEKQILVDAGVYNDGKADKVAFASGATSSYGAPAYHLIPPSFTKRVALRYTHGEEKHGDVNYQKCVTHSVDGIELDVKFARDRYNHYRDHSDNMKISGNKADDNIGACGWFLSFASWIEEFGFAWNRILNPRFVNETKFILRQNILTVETKDGKIYKEPC